MIPTFDVELLTEALPPSVTRDHGTSHDNQEEDGGTVLETLSRATHLLPLCTSQRELDIRRRMYEEGRRCTQHGMAFTCNHA